MLRSFEEQIIIDFSKPEAFPYMGKSTPRLGIWIRGYLLDVTEDYPYAMWKQWSQFCDTARAQGVMIPKNNYTQFVIYVRCLELAGLVVKTREEPYRLEGTDNEVKYSYYSVTKRMLDSRLWRNPRRGSRNYDEWHRRLKERKEEYHERRLARRRVTPALSP